MPEAYIVDYLRTPIGRYAGALAQVRTDDLAAIPIRALVERNAFLAAETDEVFLGCANQAGEDNRNVARMAVLLSGLGDSVPGVTLNRLCASGLDAVAAAARAIKAGEVDIAIAGGVESMTRAPFVTGKASEAFQRAPEIHDTTIGWRFVNPVIKAQYGIDSMPETGEAVAAQFSISRADQDSFALKSQRGVQSAIAKGVFADEIVPVVIKGRKGDVIVSADEHPRADTSAESLAILKPYVRPTGTLTVGNSAGINDGAAALVIMSGEAVARHGVTPLARIAGMASAGVLPGIMGIGPVPSTQKLMARLRLSIQAFELIELNEAFASQGLAVLRGLGVPDDAAHVNPNGGAIALGHPLAMTGARIVGTLAREMTRRGTGRGLATMCVGVGQGVSMALEGV
jgi:3-oxoadipyl-CoA thiolase